MNARQKAKYYKRKYEELANAKIPVFTINTQKVDKLRCAKFFPAELTLRMDASELDKFVKREVVDGLCNELIKYVDWITEVSPLEHEVRVVGEIKVVAK